MPTNAELCGDYRHHFAQLRNQLDVDTEEGWFNYISGNGWQFVGEPGEMYKITAKNPELQLFAKYILLKLKIMR